MILKAADIRDWHRTLLDCSTYKMCTMIYLCLALVCGLVSTQSTSGSSCQDLDTSGCQSFQKANPDLCREPFFAQNSCKRFCGNCPVECYNCPFSLTDPDDCNITTLCAPHEACMTKHLRAHDGHHEYIMTCEKKEVCSGLQFGFVGKRSPYEGFDDSDSETAGSRAERNIDIDCCETDLCNVPLMTTTTTSPPPTVTTTTKPVIKTTQKPAPTTTVHTTACHKDVVFMIDDSGSVGQTNFQHSKDFVSQLVSQMRVGQTSHNSAQVAVMAFSSHPQIEWYLDTHHTQTSLQNALKNSVPYVSGNSNTGDALQVVRTQILSSHKGDRHDADNVVVLLTDGTSQDRADTYHEADSLRRDSHDIISIGIGRSASDTELQHIATDRHHAFHISTYSQLQTIKQQVLSLICK